MLHARRSEGMPGNRACPSNIDQPWCEPDNTRSLQHQDRATAMQKFGEAWRQQDQLDPDTRQQLKDKLTFLRNSEGAKPLAGGEPPSPLEQVNSQQELLRQKSAQVQQLRGCRDRQRDAKCCA